MLKFLRFSRRVTFFKRLNIGIRLLKSSFKILVFNHHKYFIFCFLIAIAGLLRIVLTAHIDPRIPFSVLITEFLSGQSFFEIMLDHLSLPISLKYLKLNLIKTLLLFIELFIVYYISLTVTFYVFFQIYKKPISIWQSFIKSFQKFKILSKWVIIVMVISFITALFGIIGDILQFLWQLSTALSIQVIAFENKNIWQVLNFSIKYFKRIFANIIGIDLFTDLLLVLFTGFFYFLYKSQFIPAFNLLTDKPTTSFIYIFLAFYIFSTVLVSETIAFTNLYYIFYAYPENIIEKKL